VVVVKRIEDLIGMPVVSISEGVRAGKLKGVELDPVQGRIAYLKVDAEGRRADGVFPWEAVGSVGPDAITIDALASISETVPHADLPGLISYVGDRPVVTESGASLGHVHSYEVDETTGHILGYHIPAANILKRLSGRDIRFTQAEIITFGRDAIIVRDSVCEDEEAEAPVERAA
jgi:uncharacterized protein YrrD